MDVTKAEVLNLFTIRWVLFAIAISNVRVYSRLFLPKEQRKQKNKQAQQANPHPFHCRYCLHVNNVHIRSFEHNHTSEKRQ